MRSASIIPTPGIKIRFIGDHVWSEVTIVKLLKQINNCLIEFTHPVDSFSRVALGGQGLDFFNFRGWSSVLAFPKRYISLVR